MTHTLQEDEPIAVQIDDDELPYIVRWQGVPRRVQKTVERWEIHTNWWESTGVIRRTYHALILADGLFCVVYRDLITDIWHLAKIYD